MAHSTEMFFYGKVKFIANSPRFSDDVNVEYDFCCHFSNRKQKNYPL